MKKKIVILFLSIFLLSAPLVGLWRVPQAFASSSHVPININGNSQFIVGENGVVSGTGTEGDPYIIENWVISATSSDGITIQNTDVFFVIRNCVIANGSSSSWWGIYFHNVMNGQVNGNTLYDNGEGIYAETSSNIVVTGNNFTNCDWAIDFEYSCSNIILSSNKIAGSEDMGIYLYDASLTVVTDNTVSDNDNAIYLENNANIDITSNTVTDNTYGFYIVESENVTITGCLIQNNTAYGVYNFNSDLAYQVDAVNNWWGSVDGPSGAYSGGGDAVSTNVLYDPWLTSSPGSGGSPHDPISIVGNSGFNAENGVVFGDGSEGNPWIIENWVISAASSNGISIQETTEFFIIRNCVVANGSSSYYGINLSFVENGRIENNTVANNEDGVHLWFCSNITVYGNNLPFNDYGIYLYDSDNNIVTFNTVTNSYGEGICLDGSGSSGSSNNLISDNIITDSYNGIELSSFSDGNSVANNFVVNNEYGFYLYDISFNNFTGNIVTNSTEEGIDISGSYNNTFSANTISNTEYGIWFYECSNSTFVSNIVGNISTTGVFLEWSSDNILVDNKITNCGSEGIYIEDSTDNTFANNTVAFNNYGFLIETSSNEIITDCRIHDNSAYGVYNIQSNPAYEVDARNNWWGSSDGPSGVGGGSGCAVSANVLYDPWLTGLSHAPIVIESNSEFTYENGVLSGSGTEGDPYIIENWLISAESSDGITIQNTNAFFVIRNCVVNGTGSYGGLYMLNVANGRVEKNNFVDNENGIKLEYCSNISCSSNTINNNIYGIYIYSSWDNSVIDNTLIYNNIGLYLGYYSTFVNVANNNISNNHYEGIIIETTSNDTLTGNTVNYNCADAATYAITLYAASYITINNNTVAHNRGGIYEAYSANVTIAENDVYDSFNGRGIFLTGSSLNTLTGNTVSNSSIHGISLYYDSPFNIASNNTVADNGDSGFSIYQSSNNILIDNTCSNNYYYGIKVESSDNTAITANLITNNTSGVYTENSENVTITGCLIQDNTDYGVFNYDSDSAYVVDARNSWWGSGDGPSGVGGGSGDAVSANVIYEPWLTEAYPVQEKMTLVVQGDDNRIYCRLFNSSSTEWGEWWALPGATIDAPASAVCGNELHIVVRGMDEKLYHGIVDLSTSDFLGWTQISGSTPSAPTLTGNGTHLALVVRGDDDRIYYRIYDCESDSWTEWTVLSSGYTCDGPAAAMLGNDLHIVVRGMDGSSLWNMVLEPGVGIIRDWTLLSGSTPSKPALTVDSVAGMLYLGVRGEDDVVYWRGYDQAGDTWDGWNAVPDGWTCDGPAVTVVDGQLAFVVRCSVGVTLYEGYVDMDSMTFLGWELISGSTPSPPTLTS